MIARDIIPYRSRRALRGHARLGDVTSTASTAGSYEGYARAIYQAIQGDAVGGAYSAAIVAAGPIAAIGAAIANFANKGQKRDDALTQAFVEAMKQIGFGSYNCISRSINQQMLVSPDYKEYATNAGNSALLDVARAIGNGMDSTFVAQKFKTWLDTGAPLSFDKKNKTITCMWVKNPVPLPAPDATSSLPTPAPTPIANVSIPAPTPVASAPAPTPIPVYTPTVLPDAPTPAPAPVMLPATSDAPAITVNLPASVPPDQTPALIQQLLSQGASQQQAMTAALQSLAARGVPPTPQVQAMVSRDTSTPQVASTSYMILALAALFGVALIARNFR